MKAQLAKSKTRPALHADRRRLLGVLIVVMAAVAIGSCAKNGGPDSGAGVGIGAASGQSESSGDSGPDVLSVSCEPLGAFRCNPALGHQLEVCDPATVAGWTYVDTCSDPDLCDPDLGQCQVCEPGVYRCDAWRLQACDADGRGWTLLRECESAEYCDSRNAQCAECVPGSAHCSGSTLFSCNRTQDGFTSRDCGSVDNCSATSMSCRPCVPGEYQCSLETLQVCSDSRTWDEVDVCASSQLCALSLEKLVSDPSVDPRCEPAICDPGQFKCGEGDGRNLYGCPPSRAAWELLAVCDTPDLCRADIGICTDGPCLPGDMQCDGIAFQVCNATGTEWETVKTCASQDQCNVLAGDCVACTPGDKQCNGRLLQRCTDEQKWETEETCASAGLCIINRELPQYSGCKTPDCMEPGEAHRCEQNSLQVCNADLAWEPIASCASPGLCNAMDGRCNVPACPYAGDYRCQNNALEVCPSDLTAWVVQKECTGSAVCDLATLGCVETCPENRFRCNGALPEECVELDNGGIQWNVVSAPCASGGLCWASATGAGCNNPVCGGSLPDYRCNPSNPSVVERCTPGRTGWETAMTCSNGALCDPGPNGDGPAQCDICPANDFSCGNGTLSQCGPNGQTIRVLENCGTQSRCVDPADGSQGYCLRCDAGQTQCNGTNLDTCALDRRGWVSKEQCDAASGCHDNPGSGDYCNVCSVPRESRCQSSTTLLTCTAEQDSWGASTNCAYGCQDNHTSDYCRSCIPNSAQCSASSSNERRACSDVGRWQDFMTCADGSDCFDAPNDGDYCGSCGPGSAVCLNATQRQVCGNNGRWGTTLNCSGSTPICLGSVGGCVACSPGLSECSGSGGGRRVCGSDGFWDTNNCSSGQTCLEGNCVACSPGRERCTGGSVGGREVCSGTGVWEVRNCTASSAPICFEGACSQCTTTSAPRCTGSNVPGREVCSGGQWTAENCSGGDVCVAGQCQECDAAFGAQCTGATGSAGRRVCTGGEWVAQNCSGATPVCDAGVCYCETEAMRCSSTSGGRQRCIDDQWVDDACASGVCVDEGECAECSSDDDCTNGAFPSCDGGNCVCEAGEERCLGSAHQVCQESSAGNAWTSSPCSGDTPVCQDSVCVCSSGTTRCSGGSLQTCTDGAWANSPGTDCTACSQTSQCGGGTPICRSGICVACSTSANDCLNAVCVGGRCVECSSSNTTHCQEGEVCSSNNECVPCDTTNLCSGGLVCVGGVCQTGECSDGQQSCRNDARQVCSSGQWEDDPCENPNPICGTGGVCQPCTQNSQCGGGNCSDGSCEAAECTANSARCNGTIYQLCDDGEWETEEACQGGTPVCDATLGCVGCRTSADCGQATPICVANECVQCMGNENCSGTTPICVSNQCSACNDNADCSALGGVCAGNGSCQSAACSAGETECNGAAYRVCDEGSWTTQQTCNGATAICLESVGCVECETNAECNAETPICSSNACVACETGAERCASSGHQVCVVNAWTDSACEAGQVCDAGTGNCVVDLNAPPGGQGGTGAEGGGQTP